MKIGSGWERPVTMAVVAADFMWFGFMASRFSTNVSYTVFCYVLVFVVYLLWMKDAEVRLTSAWLLGISVPLVASVVLWGFSAGDMTQLWAQILCMLAMFLVPVSMLKTQHGIRKASS